SVFIVPIKVNSTHKNSVNHTINTVIPRVNSPISFEGFKVELNFLLQLLVNTCLQKPYKMVNSLMIYFLKRISKTKRCTTTPQIFHS
ncbi:MAG: hypothetical protein MR840_07160, partial [Solobacterium sp.]|nr:hypothetical protein [Solobacterium sp.]